LVNAHDKGKVVQYYRRLFSAYRMLMPKCSMQTVEKDSISHTFDTSRWPVWKDLIKTELAHFDIENTWL